MVETIPVRVKCGQYEITVAYIYHLGEFVASCFDVTSWKMGRGIRESFGSLFLS